MMKSSFQDQLAFSLFSIDTEKCKQIYRYFCYLNLDLEDTIVSGVKKLRFHDQSDQLKFSLFAIEFFIITKLCQEISKWFFWLLFGLSNLSEKCRQIYRYFWLLDSDQGLTLISGVQKFVFATGCGGVVNIPILIRIVRIG